MSPAVYQALRRFEKHMKVPIAGLCVYEAVALGVPNKYVPPLTVLVHRHKWVFPVFCGALGLHIWFYEGPVNG